MTSIELGNWYVLRTRPKYERVVREFLEERKVCVFLPQYQVLRQWSDRKKKLMVPLFPGYIFVCLPCLDYSLTKIPGVIGYLSFDAKPAFVTDREISLIRKSLDYSPVRSNYEYNLPGEEVLIIDGPFEGETGKVVRKKGQTRLIIELKSLNQLISVCLPADFVERLQECKA